jgi:hypothetical protein
MQLWVLVHLNGPKGMGAVGVCPWSRIRPMASDIDAPEGGLASGGGQPGGGPIGHVTNGILFKGSWVLICWPCRRPIWPWIICFWLMLPHAAWVGDFIMGGMCLLLLSAGAAFVV